MWYDGSLKGGNKVFRYWVNVEKDCSKFGIDEGRILLLLLKREGKVVCNYTRGWVIMPIDKSTLKALEKIKK